ncbi:RidA family protein [Mycolicibacterium mengxianglii]|uniref:RidA family protein n=1 Tax=Mycolicibacterium mengxianglii TaxID=2736649 RepID=UPI0018D136AF|nr:RidA family protein [Mycolicibacterium mengxianglii]
MNNGLKRNRNPENAPYSDSVEVTGAGRWVHFAGQMGGQWKEDGSYELPESVEQQISGVFANLGTALAAVSAEPAHVVSMTVYLRDIIDFPAYSRVRTEFFGDTPPASIVVQALLKDEAHIELVPIAFVPEAE